MTTLPPRRIPYFKAGGTLSPDIPSYVTRPADNELFERVLAGELCYVLTPRQMGKSSLVARTTARLKEVNIAAAAIDLQDSGGLDEETFYLNLLDELSRAFTLNLALEEWWDENGRLGAALRFRRFITDYLLPRIAGRIVIFIDEIDTTLTMPFRDNFFTAIRALYNARSQDSDLNRLIFVLLGVASPSELIKDQTRTPFNIGTKINLREFERGETVPLLKGLEKEHPQQAMPILERIFYWTSGHPYLTQQLCLLISQEPNHDWHDSAIDELVQQTFLSEEARNEDNIKLIQNRISGDPNKRRLLHLYERVYRDHTVQEDKTSPEQSHLLLSGLVTIENGYLQVRNQIYRNVFDRQWIRSETEFNWARTLAVTMGILAFLAVIALLYNSVWLPEQQSDYELAFLQANTDAERAYALAGLASIRPLPLLGDSAPYEQSLRELFFSLDNWSQQKAIYNAHHFIDDPDALARIVQIIYISLVETDRLDSSTSMLIQMANSLEKLGYVEDDALYKELEYWISARSWVKGSDYEAALGAYNNAIEVNPNNPAILFERARILTELGNTSTEEAASIDNFAAALSDLDRVLAFILLQPEPETSEAQPASTATQPATATSTIFPTPEESAATRFVSTPFPIPSPNIGEIPTLLPQPPLAATATVVPTQTPVPTATPIPQPLSPRFINRNQWFILIREFLQSEESLASLLVNDNNQDTNYPNLSESGLIETTRNFFFSLNEELGTSTPIAEQLEETSAIVCQPVTSDDWVLYTMEPDDTLDSLAASLNTTPDELREANCLQSAPSIGQAILVPKPPVAEIETANQLAFIRSDEIYLVDVTNTNTIQLTQGNVDFGDIVEVGLDWLLDGEHLVFPALNGRALFTLNVNTGSQAQLTPDLENVDTIANPNVSPNGTKIIFSGFTMANGYDIYMVNTEGFATQITSTISPPTTGSEDDELFPIWEPNGNKLIYVGGIAGSRLFSINEDGSGKVLWPFFEDTYGLDFSPEGNKIVFSAGLDGDYEIFIADIDGSNLIQLTNNDSFDAWPVWAPDGTQIAFISDRDNNDEIYIMNVDGSEQTRLTHSDAAEHSLAWRPVNAKLPSIP